MTKLSYTSCWEDAYLLANSLGVDKDSTILSIASAGDNSLFLASKNPKSVTCIDTSAEQLYLCQLKEEAIRTLDFEEFELLLGFKSCSHRLLLFETLQDKLPVECALFFKNNFKLIEDGLIDQGKLERYFRLFATRILPLIHSKKSVQQLFAPKSNEEQARFYASTWNNWRWSAFFKLFFSETVMGLLGRDKSKMKYVAGKVSKQIFETAEQHLKSKMCQQNYLLGYIMNGNYRLERPPYACEEHFYAAKKWLQLNKIEYAQASLEDWLEQGKSYTSYNLSNIFEYMSEQEFSQNIAALEKSALPGALVCFWNLMVPRIISQKSIFVAQDRPREDYGFFYQNFHFLRK